jgi:hypothetical protein
MCQFGDKLSFGAKRKKYYFSKPPHFPWANRLDRLDLVNVIGSLHEDVSRECQNLLVEPYQSAQLTRVPPLPWPPGESAVDTVSYLNDLQLPDALQPNNPLFDEEFLRIRNKWAYLQDVIRRYCINVLSDISGEGNQELEFRARQLGLRYKLLLLRLLSAYYTDRRGTYEEEESKG